MSKHLLAILDQPAAEQMEKIRPARGGRLEALLILRREGRPYPRAE